MSGLALLIPVVMFFGALARGIFWYSSAENLLIFLVVEVAASWNVHAFFEKKWMLGYGIYARHMNPDADKTLRAFLAVFYGILYSVFFYLYK